jgi:hypothetical protein
VWAIAGSIAVSFRLKAEATSAADCIAYNRVMQCRSCGTEIADKAIVCYRCGTATTDPVRKAVPVKPRRSPLFSFVAAAVLALLALTAWSVARTAADPDRWHTVAGALAGAALVVIALRLLRRR